MRKKRKPFKYEDEKGEYSLKDNEGLQNCPKEPLKPSKTPMTDAEAEAEMEKFWNSIKKKKVALRSSKKKPILKIPKDKLTENGEYLLKDNEGLVGSPKKSAPKDYQYTKKDEEEYQAFLDKIKKEIKKGLKKKSRRAKPRNKK